MTHDDTQNRSRRSFITRVAALGAGALAAGSILPQLGIGATQTKKAALATITLAEHEQLGSTGGFILVKGTARGDLLLIRSGKDAYTVLSNICPHRECKVKVKNEELIQCPCHKSAYSIQGKYQSGPSKKDLTDFPYTVQDGVLTITEN